MEFIDFDEIFNRKIAQMIEKHASEKTEEEWEDYIAEAYQKFGDTYIKKIDNTPRGYFAAMSDAELYAMLKEYLQRDLPVSDFLCEESEKRGVSEELLSLLDEKEEHIVHYAINLIGSASGALPKYAKMLGSSDYDEHVKDALSDVLKERADDVLEEILPLVKTKNRPYALEILSRLKQKDERAFEALLSAFKEGENIPLYAGYLASYGDVRALPVLMEEIEREDVKFVAFQELKYAIEALGGEYTKDRDFSEDPEYQAIKAASAGADIFGGKNEPKA